jgi:hypothetical protein
MKLELVLCSCGSKKCPLCSCRFGQVDSRFLCLSIYCSVCSKHAAVVGSKTFQEGKLKQHALQTALQSLIQEKNAMPRNKLSVVTIRNKKSCWLSITAYLQSGNVIIIRLPWPRYIKSPDNIQTNATHHMQK